MPNSAGKTYVEPVNDEKLMVVSVREKEVSASEITLPEKTKRHSSNPNKPVASVDFAKVSKPVKNFPSCELKNEHPYRFENGKLVCNNEKPKTVKTDSIPGLDKNLKSIIPATAFKVGSADGVDVYKTDTPDGFSTLFGVDQNGIVWSRSYPAPIHVSIGEKSIWVATPDEIVELVPATAEEYKKFAKQDPSVFDLNPKEQEKLRAYNEYSKILNTPDKYRYSDDGLEAKTLGYQYALVKIDKSGIPALLLEHQLADNSGNFGPSRMSLYLYQDTAHKLIKYDQPIVMGATSAGGARAGVGEAKDKNGLWLSEWGSGTGEGTKTLIQAQDGEIRKTKTINFNLRNNTKSEEGGDSTNIDFYPVSEREPLIKALNLKFLDKNQTKKADSSSNAEHDKEVAQAKKDGYQTYDGTLKIISIGELKKLYPEFIVAIGNQDGYFPASYRIAVLILPKKTMITAHNGDGLGERTEPAAFIYLASEKYGDGFKQLQEYNGKQVTLAAKHLWWASDVGPYGNQPIAGEATGEANKKIIP